jgi:hypothetical protein
MSGPKVARIVTREDVIAACEGHLARLDAAIARWRRVGHRNQVISDSDLASVVGRRAALQHLLDTEQFATLQQQAPTEIAFLQEDTQHRLQRAAAAIRDARRASRRMARTAQSLREALERTTAEVPERLQQELERAAAGDAVPEDVYARAFALLRRPDQGRLVSKRQRLLADALSEGEQPLSLADWLASQPALTEDQATRRIEDAIAELTALTGQASTRYLERANGIDALSPGAHRDLLADSLLLDVLAELKQQKADAGVLAELEAQAAVLGRFESQEARDLRKRADTALLASDPHQAASLAPLIAKAIASEEREVATAARRMAILNGLAGLGYEVTEGMDAAWVREGRVVLRSAGRPSYGVEIGGQLERFQVRAVALGDAAVSRDVGSDRDAEALWCTEFTQLKLRLAKAGASVIVEQALPVGATPLKIVAAHSALAYDDDVSFRELRRK